MPAASVPASPSGAVTPAVYQLPLDDTAPKPTETKTTESRDWSEPLLRENAYLTIIVKNVKKGGRIYPLAWDLARELGAGNAYPGILNKLAQFEVALLKFMEANLGASEFGVFADSAAKSTAAGTTAGLGSRFGLRGPRGNDRVNKGEPERADEQRMITHRMRG